MNGEKSCLTFQEATNGEEEESAVEMVEEEVERAVEKSQTKEERVVEMVEEENPDCVILVYAIDDRETFGE